MPQIRQVFANGAKAVNGWCAIPSPVTAEIMGRQGFDLMTVDLQHGLIDYQTALTMLQVLQGLAAPVMARVPWNEPGIIAKVLDAGFAGLICPMVNTVEDAQRLVQATRYAPMGSRSFGPTRANMVFGPGYAKSANTEVMVFAMIETREALGNLDAILSVAGIDGVYVGPSDLGLSLGYEPTLDPTAAEVLDAIATIANRTKAAGRLAGIHTGSPEMIRRAFVQGYDFASLLTDARLFTSAVAGQLALVHQTTIEAVKGY
ncbi:2,4-dihydroxyhept-2-ene-1,7-dioic acid aldolase [Cypionkella aquatica]|uniref:2,4-dihydroxyhept-2-ene-1,7-dioic acid aldolase n=1 Tax=Cypionkella aquatica TaxID=1756042 RepID=A0AA37U0B5_9RHOB|nr:aldolase/citrate lyase family protein [Cypionkella aquatica]GLS88620.1 2,4-dihydroxyhept-2-ene-1,7-dioic acid aldolase [Cypionkella aquatica]GLS88670.1 2,4-dihydroxyhept-2-ene-1,7-dioic acid aldolase [Cypionkella aquatica]